MTQMVLDYLALLVLEEKIADIPPYDLLAHTGVHLTKVQYSSSSDYKIISRFLLIFKMCFA